MKYSILISSLCIAIFLAFSCSSSQSVNRAAPDYSNLQSLDQILRMQGGLNVQGGGNNVKVYVRGISTFTLETQPLYVIDGVRIGHDYSRANNAVNVKDIVSIKVLASKSETTIYGEEGTNGVIIIKTRLSTD